MFRSEILKFFCDAKSVVLASGSPERSRHAIWTIFGALERYFVLVSLFGTFDLLYTMIFF